MRFYILILAFGISFSQVISAALPETFSAKYYSNKPVLGDADVVISFHKKGQYYKYAMRSDVRYLYIFPSQFFDCSVIKIEGNEVLPIEHLHREGKNSKYNVYTQFDWDSYSALVNYESRNLIKTVPISSNLWDPMSIQVKLIYDQLNGRLIENKKYHILDQSEVKVWDIKKPKYVKVKIKKGQYEALKVTATSNDEKIVIWMSDKYGYLPLQLEIKNVLVKMVSDPMLITSSILKNDNNAKLKCKG